MVLLYFWYLWHLWNFGNVIENRTTLFVVTTVLESKACRLAGELGTTLRTGNLYIMRLLRGGY